MAKVRIGFGLGTGGFGASSFADLVDGLEDLGFDSLWMSERVTGPALDPLMALAVAAGRTRKLKLGTSVLVLPGHNPVLLAKELATLDQLSGGRALPAFGLGTAQGAEHQAFAVKREERASIFDEALPLIRRLWTEEEVTHHGTRFHLDGISVLPKPIQSPPDVWLGGRAPSELRRVGRLGDGWLPSFSTPAEAEEGRAQVEEAAAKAGRTIDPEHWGALVLYGERELPEALSALLSTRRPGKDPGEVVAQGPDRLRLRLGEWVRSGFSKLVVVPVGTSSGAIVAGLPALAGAVLDMQSTKKAA
jgi:probable F420-dependent oxidoreductase